MPDSSLLNTFYDAIMALLTGDIALWEVILLSLKVSLTAVFIGLFIGIPFAFFLAVYNFTGKKLCRVILDTLMALPPVVIGLIVYLLISRNGPLGVWGLLYTPAAMIMAQAVLITPLIAALSYQFLSQHWERLGDQLKMLGFKPYQTFKPLLQESKQELSTVALAAFGRAIAEIGAVMIVGGNIEHHTRVMTTAIAMETRQGNLSLALALGLILIIIALIINASVHWIKQSKIIYHAR